MFQHLLHLTIGITVTSHLTAAQPPNIVHIFADDLGKGSVGVHGQLDRETAGFQHIKTPHLDSLSRAGMTFNRAYAATLCSPSRGMLYLGFSQAHNANDRNTVAPRAQDVTVAEVLKPAGYTTSVFGKWGFGGSGGTQTSGNKQDDLRINPSVTNISALPNTHGYDEFLGYINHSRAHRYYTSSLWTTDATGNPVTGGLSELMLGNVGPGNSNLHVDYTHDIVGERCEQFIEDHHDTGNPFYLQVNYTIPHNDLEAIQFEPGWFDAYASVNTTDWTNKERYYAAMITRMDASIGSLIAKLEDPAGDGNGAGNDGDNLLPNTIILFTSDNGATDADFNTAGLNAFGINDLYRGGKRDLWEGGINMPFFVRWDGVVPAGSSSDLLTDLTDFMATAADLAGVPAPVGIDGVSIVPTLTGQGTQRIRDFLTFEHHEGDGPDPNGLDARWAILRGDDKVMKFSNGERRLYDLGSDPDENGQLDQGVPANAALVQELTELALADGVEQPAGYDHEYAAWTGGDGDDLADPAHWDLGTAPGPTWSAVVGNAGGSDEVAVANSGVDVLGLEVRGDGALQTVRVPGTRVTGRNAVRISEGGRVHLDQGTLASWRWTDILAGGVLTGHGTVEDDVHNLAGTIAPGLPGDLPPPAPPPVVTPGLATAVDFDIQGQDPASVTTSDTISPYVQITAGLQIGPGIGPRNAADEGNEFNVTGFPGDNSSLADAVAGGDYLTYTIAPLPGVEMRVDTLSFELRRNGSGAAQEYAILSTLDGFTEPIGSLSTGASDDTTRTLNASYAGGQWISDPLEVRLYAWDQEGGNGNTHVYDAGMSAEFRAIPAVTLDTTGVLSITGDFEHAAGATVALELGGSDNSDPLDPGFDAIEVTGDAVIAGVLEVGLVGGYVPPKGTSFKVLTADSVTGEFNHVDDVVMTADQSAAFRIHYSATEVILEALEGGVAPGGTPNWWLDESMLPPGADGTDTDGDGRTEAEEYAANTGPRDSSDRFEAAILSGVEGHEIHWDRRTDRVYQVECSATMRSGSWAALGAPVGPGDPGPEIQMLPESGEPRAFYRVVASVP